MVTQRGCQQLPKPPHLLPFTAMRPAKGAAASNRRSTATDWLLTATSKAVMPSDTEHRLGQLQSEVAVLQGQVTTLGQMESQSTAEAQIGPYSTTRWSTQALSPRKFTKTASRFPWKPRTAWDHDFRPTSDSVLSFLLSAHMSSSPRMHAALTLLGPLSSPICIPRWIDHEALI